MNKVTEIYNMTLEHVSIQLSLTVEFCILLLFSKGLTEVRERSGSVVECLTQDRRAVGSSLTGVTALWSLSKTHLY